MAGVGAAGAGAAATATGGGASELATTKAERDGNTAERDPCKVELGDTKTEREKRLAEALRAAAGLIATAHSGAARSCGSAWARSVADRGENKGTRRGVLPRAKVKTSSVKGQAFWA